MTILICGGGTGGHITPLLAVAHELKKLDSACKIIYVGERGGKFKSLLEASDAINGYYYVSAGKFRRYHNEPLLRKLTDVKTFVLNFRDFFRFLRGTLQSLRLMQRIKPDVVFIKGGYVGVPVGLAASFHKISIVTHDSDTMPGLANRILAKRVSIHATGMPSELYSYPEDKTRYTGIPVSDDYQKLTGLVNYEALRTSLSIPEFAKVLLVTGGSQGARQLNQIVESQYEELLALDKDVFIIHQVGQGNMTERGSKSLDPRLKIVEFLNNLAQYMAVANVVITRASATTIAELGTLAKPTIAIPSPFLAGGHQLKNASFLEQHEAAISLEEDKLAGNPTLLTKSVKELIGNEQRQKDLGMSLHKLIKPNASIEIAKLLLDTGGNIK